MRKGMFKIVTAIALTMLLLSACVPQPTMPAPIQQPPASVPPTQTRLSVTQTVKLTANIFIVRIRLEWSESGSCWHGQIEHVQSKQKCAFLNLWEMVTFIQGHVTMPDKNDDLVKGGSSRKNII